MHIKDSTIKMESDVSVGGRATMASVPEQEPIFTSAIRSKWRLDILCHKECCSKMYQVFKWGCKMPPNITLYQYLSQCKKFSNLALKSKFTKQQLKKINMEYDVSSFDITLLFASIQFACEKLPEPSNDIWTTKGETLAYFLHCVKEFRNYLIHDEIVLEKVAFLEKFEEIRSLLIKMLKSAGILYDIDSREVNDIISEMNITINRIRDEPLASHDLQSYRSEVLFGRLVEEMKRCGKEELKQRYNKTRTTCVSPVTFIAGSNIHIEVGVVFITLRLTDGGRYRDNSLIQYEDILRSVNQEAECAANKVILVEGVAGAGKTTLSKMIISHWKSSNTAIYDLNTYDFLILMECKISSISSVQELLDMLIPETLERFQKEDHLPLLKRQRILFLVDGLDELNESSLKLFQELLELKKCTNIQILMFSRPEKVEDLYKMAKDFDIVHIRVGDIPITKRVAFVKGYHEELKRQGKSKQETPGLINYLETTGSRLHHLWGLPLYLVMMTVLWAIAPDKVNRITTGTELYMAILELTSERLMERLMSKSLMQGLMTTEELRKKVKQVLLVISKVALFGLRDDSIVISSESHDKLQIACKDLGLPDNEVISALLVMKSVWTTTAIFISVGFPHKGTQDFLAALFIFHMYSGGHSGDNDDSRVVQDTERTLMTTGMAPCQIQVIIQKMIQAMGLGSYPELIIPTNAVSHASRTPESVPPSILEILKKVHKHNPEGLTLSKYQNTLTHLLGLIYMTGKNTLISTAKELVELLKDSGVSDSRQWLTILSGVKCDKIVAKYISEVPMVLGDGEVYIDDSQVYGAWTLFQYIQPLKVCIRIESNPKAITCLEDLLLLLEQCKCEVILDIYDNSVTFYLQVLQRLQPKIVNFWIESDPSEVPDLEDLLLLLANREYSVGALVLEGAWRDPKPATDAFIKAVGQVVTRCGVEKFRGRASWLPQEGVVSVLSTHLTVMDEYDAACFTKLCASDTHVDHETDGDTNSTRTRATTWCLPRLVELRLHVVAGVSKDVLPTLPQLPMWHRVVLWLSGVGDSEVQWAANVVGAMRRDTAIWKYGSIVLPSNLSLEGMKEWIRLLQYQGVQGLGAIYISSPKIPQHEEKVLCDLAHELLECGGLNLLGTDRIW